MAYSTGLHWTGATGVYSEDGAEYTAVHRVDTDDPTHQAQTVLAWFRGNVVELGDAYSYSADTDADAVAKRMRAKRDMKTLTRWLITVSYGPIDDEDGKDSNGNSTSNPLDFRPTIRANTVQYQRPVDTSKFLGGYHGTAAAMMPVGDMLTPCNSVGMPFNPRPMRDDSRTTVTVTRNLATWDADEAELWCNAINQNTFTIAKFGFIGLFAQRTTRIRSFSADLRRQNSIDFWEGSCTFDRDPRRWVDPLLDQGVHARALDGDPDGRGGFFSASSPRPKGIPQIRRLLDNDEMPISDPVLLDGDGQPLDLSEMPIRPVFGRWLHYTERPYQGLAFLSGIIS